MSLSIAESELYVAVKTASGRLAIERGEGHGHCMWVEPTSGCHCDDVLGLPRKSGQGKARRHAELVDTKKLPSQERYVTKKVSNERESRRHDDQTTAGTKDRAAHRKIDALRGADEEGCLKIFRNASGVGSMVMILCFQDRRSAHRSCALSLSRRSSQDNGKDTGGWARVILEN